MISPKEGLMENIRRIKSLSLNYSVAQALLKKNNNKEDRIAANRSHNMNKRVKYKNYKEFWRDVFIMHKLKNKVCTQVKGFSFWFEVWDCLNKKRSCKWTRLVLFKYNIYIDVLFYYCNCSVQWQMWTWLWD